MRWRELMPGLVSGWASTRGRMLAYGLALLLVTAAGCTATTERPDDGREVSAGAEIIQIADFVNTAARLAESYDTPPGGRIRPETIEPSVIAVESLESIVAFRVACQWFQHWLDTRATADTPAEETARATLEGLSGWPIVLWDGLVPFYEPLIIAVMAGDDAAIEYHLDVNCPDVRLELPGA